MKYEKNTTIFYVLHTIINRYYGLISLLRSTKKDFFVNLELKKLKIQGLIFKKWYFEKYYSSDTVHVNL